MNDIGNTDNGLLAPVVISIIFICWIIYGVKIKKKPIKELLNEIFGW